MRRLGRIFEKWDRTLITQATENIGHERHRREHLYHPIYYHKC